jgi:hypothetical protein
VLALPVDQQVVAIEHRVMAAAQHPAGAHRDQRRPAGSDDVEPFMRAPTAPWGSELADEAAGPVRPVNWEDVRVVAGAAVGAGRGGRGGESGEGKEG